MISNLAYEKMIGNSRLANDVFRHLRSRGVVLPGDKSPESQKTPVVAATALVFQGEQPSVFFEHEAGIPFRGQTAQKEILAVKIAALGPDDRLKCMFTGAAGSGKTALAWITAKRLQEHRRSRGLPEGRFFEILPSQIANKADLDLFMQQLRPYDIVFIDEIHILKQNVGAEPLYHTLADTGSPRYPLGMGSGWVDVPTSVSWLAATTEPGELDDTTGGALRRRLSPEIRLDPPGEEVLVEILQDQDVPITAEAAQEIARRSGGLPWQALNLYNTSKDFASYEGKHTITLDVGHKAFTAMGVDSHGLFPEDRNIISVLLQSPHRVRSTDEIRYKMSETALCAAAGVDRNTYKHIVQPRLMRLGFLTTVGGQCLTPKAVDTFNV